MKSEGDIHLRWKMEPERMIIQVNDQRFFLERDPRICTDANIHKLLSDLVIYNPVAVDSFIRSFGFKFKVEDQLELNFKEMQNA